MVDLTAVAAANSPGGLFSSRTGAGTDPGDKHNRVRVRNVSGQARRRGEVLQIEDHVTAVLDPAYVGLDGETPQDGFHCFAILQQDVPSNEIAPAAVSGATLAQVCFYDLSHRFAAVDPGKCVLRSVATGPIPIISPPPASLCKHEVLVLLPTICFEPPTTTTAAPEPLAEPICSGKCKWVASAGLVWVKDPSSSCAAPTTTTTAGETTTTAATPTTGPGTSTTAEPTTTTTVCCCDVAAPTTTTTAEPCDCLYPTLCPSEAGECTYTQCTSGATNQPPNCNPTTTTAEPITTTTCDCETVEPPSPCSAGCDWVGVPSGSGGAWAWHRTSNGCAANCPCPSPTSDPYCATAHTDCVLQPPPPPPPPTPGCSGSCSYVWVAALGVYYRTYSGCATVPGCACQPPSDPSPCAALGCCPVDTPCVAPPATTTTGEALPYTGCQYTCLGTAPTTTTAGPTTTTTVGCDTGGCRWASNETATAWVGPSNDTCPDGCPCIAPSRLPYDACEVIAVGCHGDPPTTTTAPPTTTTPEPACDGLSLWYCDGTSWEIISHSCAGSCIGVSGPCSPASPGGPCNSENVGLGVGDCYCEDVDPTTTAAPTTTTAAPTTTTAAPTTTTTSECHACITELCLGLTNAACWQCTAGGWVQCCEACEEGTVPVPPAGTCSEANLGASATVPCQPPTTTTPACGSCVYECVYGAWTLYSAACDAGCVCNAAPTGECVEFGAFLDAGCSPTTTTTPGA